MINTIHLVSHTHWDREWYLSFQQFRIKLVHLIDHLLDILDSDSDFRYFLLDGQAIILEDYLEIHPERRVDLTRHIKTGRILTGPWYISPDEFLVSPESHIRNLIEGDKICQNYGAKMPVGYLPDTFGHIGQMPQILQGFDIHNTCFWRGLEDQPCELIWKSPDGSTVLLSYLRDSYGNAARLVTSDAEEFVKDISEISASLAQFSSTGQILLMHGIDHMEPPADLGQALRKYQSKADRINLMHSNLPLYFDAVHEAISSTGLQLPVITGELRSSKHAPLLQNVLSTRIWIKQRNHNCETNLLKWVEPLLAISNLLNLQAPSIAGSNNLDETFNNRNAILRYAWKLLMQCHPHDSICGTTIDQVADEIQVRFDQVDQINYELINQCLFKINEHINTSFPENQPTNQDPLPLLSSILVFNPNDATQTGLITEKIKFENHIASFDIIDKHGISVPYEQSGMGVQELISMKLDPKGLRQALGMIYEGHVAGMIIRDFTIESHETQAIIHVTLSEQGDVDLAKWKRGIAHLAEMLADHNITDYLVHAYSDPETDVSFVARDVPGHGYQCYWIRDFSKISARQSAQVKPNPIFRVLLPTLSFISRIPLVSRLVSNPRPKSSRKTNAIENKFYMIRVNSSESTISIFDKRTGKLYSGMNQLVDDGDCGDVYNYCPPKNNFSVTAKIKAIERIEKKTYQQLILTYELKIPAGLSDDRTKRSDKQVLNKIKSTITLVPGVQRVDVHTEVDNLATDHRLRVHFPASFNATSVFYDSHFEIVSRPIGTVDYDETWEEPPRAEVPQLKYTAITNGQSSLIIANRGLPEVEVYQKDDENSVIAITLLRCIGWLSRDDLTTRKGHAAPMGLPTPDAQMLGKYAFDYAIIPVDENWRNAVHQAISFNASLRSITTAIHQGDLPSQQSFIENNNPAFIITTIKQAEDGAGLIIRGYNSLASSIELGLKIQIPFKHAQLVSLNEKFIREVPIDNPGVISLHVDGYKIATLRLSD